MKFISILFFTDIDFSKPNVSQDLHLNFNLYFIFLKGEKVSNNIVILSKYIFVEVSGFSSSVFNKSSQST